MLKKLKKMVIGFSAVKLAKAVKKKIDVSEYAIIAADAVDTYLDKTLGKKSSEKIQDEICIWLKEGVDIFTTVLKKN